MKTLYETLQSKFDLCKVLTMSSRQDRRDFIEKQFGTLGLGLALESNYISYHYTTPFPYNGLIAQTFNNTNKGLFSKPNEYDCARSHYSIVKTCYDLGYNHCLIMEDDIRFLKNQELFISFLEHIPNDYDILQFGAFTMDKKAAGILDHYDNGEFWVMHDGIYLWNASMYALSRKGMQYYIGYMDKFFTVADMPLFKAPLNNKLVKAYVSTIPLVIQADKDVILSDIRNKDNDNIDYKTMNVYESRVKFDDYL